MHYDLKTNKRVQPETPTLDRSVLDPRLNVNPSNFVQNDPSNPACASKAHVWALKCVGCGAKSLSNRKFHVGNPSNNVRVSMTYTPPAQNHITR